MVQKQVMRAVNVPDELWEEAKRCAEEQGVSVSALVRKGLMREVAWWNMTEMRTRVSEMRERVFGEEG